MVGVCSAHGFDEGWNEGPGYSNSKFKWFLNSMLYLDSVFPEFGVARNPWLDRIGEWFCRVTPVGMNYAPWGHQSNNRGYYENGRISNFHRFAYLTGNGILLHNWKETGGTERGIKNSFRPWTDCALSALYKTPVEAVANDPVGLFLLAGWIMVGTKPPSTKECYETSVGMIFQCRPLGGYSHSFASENSFHI